jgi:hypothetical protein
VTRRRGRRGGKLLGDLKEKREYSHLREEALDRTMWRARFGRGFGLVVRKTAEGMNEVSCIDPREELSGTPCVGAYIGPKAAVDAPLRHQMPTIRYKPRHFSEGVVTTHL